MKITRLEINNFLSIGEASLNLDDKGLVLLQGINNDDTSAASNGAGKSSLASSILWCLFGETDRDAKGDEVVNVTSRKNCRVAMTVDDDGVEYVIARHRKHIKHKNSLTVSVNGIDETRGTSKLTQALVTQLIGCTKEVFNASIYAGQESLIDLPGLTDKQLKVIVEEASGVEILEKALTIARKGLFLASSQVSDQKIEVDKIENEIRVLKGLAAAAQDDADKWAALKVSELKKAKSALIKANDSHEMAKLMLKTSSAGISSVKDKYEQIGKDIISGTIKDKKLITAAQDDLGIRIAEVASVDSILKMKLTDAKKASKDLKSINSKVGAPCGECGKEYELTDIAGAQTRAKNKLDLAAAELTELKSQRVAAINMRTNAESALESLQENATDVTALMSDRDSNKILIDAHTSLQIDADKANLLFDDAKKAHSELKARANPYDAEPLNKKISDKRVDLKALKTYLEKLKDEEAVKKAVVAVYSPAGVRAQILDSVTPYLNSRTEFYLSSLSDSNLSAEWNTLSTKANGDLTEKFNIAVNSKTASATYKGLSGGEKRKVRLACFLALQDLVSSRATKPIDLAICDEIDDALDDSGLERLMDVLEAKARKSGTVIVISHNDLKDWIRDVSIIEKTDGLAEISGVLSL